MRTGGFYQDSPAVSLSVYFSFTSDGFSVVQLFAGLFCFFLDFSCSLLLPLCLYLTAHQAVQPSAPSGWSRPSGVRAAVRCRTGTKTPLTLVLLKQSVFRLIGRTCGFRGCTSPGAGLGIPIMEKWIIDEIMEFPDRIMESRQGFCQQTDVFSSFYRSISLDALHSSGLLSDGCR